MKYIDLRGESMVLVRQFNGFPSTDFTIGMWLKWRDPEEGDAPFDEAARNGDPPRTSRKQCGFFGYNAAFGPTDGPQLRFDNLDALAIFCNGETVETGVRVAGDTATDWVHLSVGIFSAGENRSRLTVRVNGERKFERTIQRVAFLDRGPLVFGTAFEDDGGSRARFVGSVAELRVQRGERSELDTLLDMAAAGPHNAAGIALYLPLDESTASEKAARDTSGNGNDAVIRLARVADTARPWDARSLDLGSRFDLTGRDLSGGHFDGARFTGARLHGVNMSNAVFRRADFGGAEIVKVLADGADFSDTDFTQASLGLNCFEVRQGVQPRFERTKINLEQLQLDWSKLNLEGAELRGLDQSPDLTGLAAGHAILRGMNFTGLRMDKADFTGADLARAEFLRASLNGAKFNRGAMLAANFTAASLIGAEFMEAHLGGSTEEEAAHFDLAYMPNAKLNKAEAFGAVFSDAHLYGGEASLEGAHLEQAKFAGANLSGMQFTEAVLRGADFTGALLFNCDFRNARIGPTANFVATVFTRAHVEGADFTGTSLASVDFAGAAFSLEPGEIPVTRVGPNNELVDENAHFGATVFEANGGDAHTVWPDGSRGALHNPAVQLLALDPPHKPACVPTATSWCPVPGHGG